MYFLKNFIHLIKKNNFIFILFHIYLFIYFYFFDKKRFRMGIKHILTLTINESNARIPIKSSTPQLLTNQLLVSEWS